MSEKSFPVALVAGEVAPRSVKSSYPEPFASRMNGREKRPLGNAFGLQNFGVNLTRLAPGAVASPPAPSLSASSVRKTPSRRSFPRAPALLSASTKPSSSSRTANSATRRRRRSASQRRSAS